MRNRLSSRRVLPAFTLVELLVVIGIIGILVAILLPSIHAVRTSARNAETTAVFNAISGGLETYRNATGDPYPPSASDADPTANVNEFKGNWTANPTVPGSSMGTPTPISITGANLLLWALAGADFLGTPGFKDINNDGLWWNDTHMEMNDTPINPGLYDLNSQAQPLHKRYGPFIDIGKTKIAKMQDFALDTLKPKKTDRSSYPPGHHGSASNYDKTSFVLDGFGYPILYYRARVGASSIVTDRTAATVKFGVYDQADNRLYTGEQIKNAGSDSGTARDEGDGLLAGMDLGSGNDHKLYLPTNPGTMTPTTDLADVNNTFKSTFVRYIWDQKITVRNEPVNKDSYILISPGPDALWGTDDDVTNFKK